MNTAEQEILRLCIAVEALNDIVNKALFEVRPVSSQPGQAEVYFHSRVHQELFLARLLDFSKESGRKTITGVNGSCLDVVSAACDTRSFDKNNSVYALAESVAAFRYWLNYLDPLRMWIPMLDIEAKVSLPRSELLFIMGNQVKHNLARLSGVSRKVGELFQYLGYSVEEEQVPLALDDIREHLQENYFVYYGSWLVELINNLLWGIHDYLAPVYSWSYSKAAEDTYKYPSVITETIAQEWFWRLMNHVRTKPYLERFACPDYLKKCEPIEK